jgi:hypothetical protein
MKIGISGAANRQDKRRSPGIPEDDCKYGQWNQHDANAHGHEARKIRNDHFGLFGKNACGFT